MIGAVSADACVHVAGRVPGEAADVCTVCGKELRSPLEAALVEADKAVMLAIAEIRGRPYTPAIRLLDCAQQALDVAWKLVRAMPAEKPRRAPYEVPESELLLRAAIRGWSAGKAPHGGVLTGKEIRRLAKLGPEDAVGVIKILGPKRAKVYGDSLLSVIRTFGA